MAFLITAGFAMLCVAMGWLRINAARGGWRIPLYAVGSALLLLSVYPATAELSFLADRVNPSFDVLFGLALVVAVLAAAWGIARVLAAVAPALPPRSRRQPLAWAAVALLIMAAGIGLGGLTAWTAIMVLLLGLTTFLAPSLAARLAPAAVVALAAFTLLTVVWPESTTGSLRYAFGYAPWNTWYLFQPGAVPPAIAIGVASALLAAAWWLSPLVRGREPWLPARLAEALDARLSERLQHLTQTRTDAVDSAAAELRRIERDLHDGAQARLVAVGMSLGAAQRLIATQPQAAAELVREAMDASARALAELRDLLRGISPPVLADRGLGDAIRALTLDTPLRTELDLDLPGRLPAPVETAAYFAVAEALANAVKHAGARAVHIRAWHATGVLRIEVTDDGTGGADPLAGTGLRGLERRLATLDGILAVSSPAGGPTIVVIEVPCALSSPKISTC